MEKTLEYVTLESQALVDDFERSHRKFADFFIIDDDGQPTEWWMVFTVNCYLDEKSFRKLIYHLRLDGLFYHDADRWTISEGLKVDAKRKLIHHLTHFAHNTNTKVWLVQIKED